MQKILLTLRLVSEAGQDAREDKLSPLNILCSHLILRRSR